MDNSGSNSLAPQLNFAQHHAFIIGINKYQNVKPLQTAVADAEQIAKVLGNGQHFLVHPPLLDATGADIRLLLEKTLPQVVAENDRVFFYFAGHGIAADGDDGPSGYIIPADAEPNDFTSFIPMDMLQNALNALPCRHLLLVMDCCFAGAFKWSVNKRNMTLSMPKRIYKERFDRFIHDPAWQVITSSAYNQEALDVLNGKTTGQRGEIRNQESANHSPFAQALFDGLSGAADACTGSDAEGDGVITATELYAYIRDQVEPASINEAEHLRQTPGFFPLKKHDKGEFIFLKPNHRLNLPPIPKQSPYKGLVSFDEPDRDLFYGRDRAIEALRAKAVDNKLLVVSGASGTGKSSVIKAGLLPLLRDDGYRILDVIRPGAHPIAALNKALSQLKADSSGADSTHTSSASAAVLLIDQFEEVITRCEDPQERNDFDKGLAELLDDTRIHKLILTIRSDFEPQLSDGALKAKWQQGKYVVPPFSIEELKEVVLLPTIQEVLIFDPPDLVDIIVEEVVQSPGALPLLSYTLNELYEAYRTSGRQDRALTKADYDTLGGVMGSLRTKADAVYAQLPPASQDIMRKIMLRMISVEGELAGKRVAIDDLVYTDSLQNTVNQVIELLVDARLIVKGKNYIEPAHDALVRAWKQLNDWTFAVGKDKLILGSKLTVVANEFAATSNQGLLWNNNPHLPVLLKEITETKHWFNAKEISFINKSYRRKVNNKRWGLGITAAVMISLAWAAIYSTQQSYRAIKQLKHSTALLSSSDSSNIINNDTIDLTGGSERALQQSLAAFELVSPLGKTNWIESLLSEQSAQVPASVFSSGLVAKMSLNKGVQYIDMDFTVRALAISEDAQKVIVGGLEGASGVVKLWDKKTGTVTSLLQQPQESIYTVAYDPSTSLIVASGRQGDLWLWPDTEKPPIHIDLPGFISSVAFSHNGKELLAVSVSQNVFRYRVSDLLSYDPTVALKSIGDMYSPGVESYALSTSADGSHFAVLTDFGRRVWQLNSLNDSWEIIHTDDSSFRGPSIYKDIAMNQDGTLMATAGSIPGLVDEGTVNLWSSASNYKVPRELAGLPDARAVAISPDGSTIAAGGANGKVVIWDVETGRKLAETTRIRKLEVLSVKFSADSNRVISSGEDGILHIWNIQSKPSPELDTCTNQFNSIDGSYSLTGGLGDRSAGYGGSLSLTTVHTSISAYGHLKGSGDDTKEAPAADKITCIKQSAYDQTVVSASSNNTIQFWRLDDQSVSAIGPSVPGHDFVLTPNGKFIVVLEREREFWEPMLIRIYDIQARSPVGFWLVNQGNWEWVRQEVSSINGVVELREKLCAKLTRNMTHRQWQEWVSSDIEYVTQCPGLPIPASAMLNNH